MHFFQVKMMNIFLSVKMGGVFAILLNYDVQKVAIEIPWSEKIICICARKLFCLPGRISRKQRDFGRRPCAADCREVEK